MCMWVGTGDTKLFLRALHLEEPNYQERKAELCKEGIQQEAGELEWSTGCGAGALCSSLQGTLLVCQPSLT